MWLFRPTIQSLVDEIKGATELFISAPWASELQLRSLLEALAPKAEVEIWMRLNPDEVSLQNGQRLLEILNKKGGVRLARHPGLHWKAYLSKKIGFIGSSNCTEYGLPSEESNSIEALLRLTSAQLSDAWTIKKQISIDLNYFESIDKAIDWWENQSHMKEEKPTPDAPAKSLKKRKILSPKGFMR
jgi:hypothetical protein